MDSLEAADQIKNVFFHICFQIGAKGQTREKRSWEVVWGGEAWLNLQFDKIQRRIAILKDEWKIYIF